MGDMLHPEICLFKTPANGTVNILLSDFENFRKCAPTFPSKYANDQV